MKAIVKTAFLIVLSSVAYQTEGSPYQNKGSHMNKAAGASSYNDGRLLVLKACIASMATEEIKHLIVHKKLKKGPIITKALYCGKQARIK